jgi:hypothetical protein
VDEVEEEPDLEIQMTRKRGTTPTMMMMKIKCSNPMILTLTMIPKNGDVMVG